MTPPLVAAAVSLCLGAALLHAQSAQPLFEDVAEQAGLRFVHVSGAAGDFHMPENLGPGVALFDYDNDGDLDVFVLQGITWDAWAAAEPRASLPSARLFRNDLVVRPDGTRTLTFTDVTAQAGVGFVGHGMGVAVGDYDGDGWIDLYVTSFGRNALYRNNGDGTFSDVTMKAGVQDERWGMSAAFLDIDGDGHLDLFVTNYLDFTLAASKPCTESGGARDYCAPTTYRPVPDRLFRNRGNGTFEDVSERAGILRAFGNGLGVSVGDYDLDGHLDIFVANDATPNQLWRNMGDGTFEDMGLLSGTAFNAAGRPEGSMGIASGDHDASGAEDLVVTHIVGETFVLYQNDGTGGFEDRRVAAGLAQPTAMMTGFGIEWIDVDNDGVLDLLIANGAVNIIPALRGTDNPYRQRNQIFRGVREADGGRDGSPSRPSPPAVDPSPPTTTVRFEEVTGAAAGAALALLEVSRAVAIGDLDNDGFADAVISNNDGPLRLLRNTGASGQAWVGFDLRQAGANQRAVGATVTVEQGPAAGALFRVRSDGSYLAASDTRVLVGLGRHTGPVSAVVAWPDGTRERFEGLQPGRYHALTRGGGTRPVSR
jgi:enediyne biosynthesis protein E4